MRGRVGLGEMKELRPGVCVCVCWRAPWGAGGYEAGGRGNWDPLASPFTVGLRLG